MLQVCFVESRNTTSRSLGAGEMMMAPSTKSPWMRAVGPAALASSARMGDAMRHQRPSSAMQMEAEMTWAPSDGVYIYIYVYVSITPCLQCLTLLFPSNFLTQCHETHSPNNMDPAKGLLPIFKAFILYSVMISGITQRCSGRHSA